VPGGHAEQLADVIVGVRLSSSQALPIPKPGRNIVSMIRPGDAGEVIAQANVGIRRDPTGLLPQCLDVVGFRLGSRVIGPDIPVPRIADATKDKYTVR
jgi:hypothetical protein